MSNLSAALDYLRPIAASATVGKYPEHLATLIAAVERLQAERDEVCALRDENARLRADLDAGFAASDHLSAKYYRRMRVAERAADNMRSQIESRAQADRAAALDEMTDRKGPDAGH